MAIAQLQNEKKLMPELRTEGGRDIIGNAAFEGGERIEKKQEEAVKISRKMFVKARYEFEKARTKISEVIPFLKMNLEGHADVNELHNQYRNKKGTLLRIKLDSLKKRGLDEEVLRKEMGNLVNYFNGNERIELFDNYTSVDAKFFEDKSEERKFEKDFLIFTEWFKNNGDTRKSFLSAALKDFGIGFSDKTMERFLVPKETEENKAATLGMRIIKEISGEDSFVWGKIKEQSYGDAKKSESAEILKISVEKYVEILGNKASPEEDEKMITWIARIAKLLTGKENEIQAKLMVNLNLARLPEDQKKELINKMNESLLKRIFLETLKKLSLQDKEKYQDMIENEPGPEEADNFLKGRIQGYEEMVKKIIDNFIEEMKKEI